MSNVSVCKTCICQRHNTEDLQVCAIIIKGRRGSTYQVNPSNAIRSWKVRLINFLKDLHFDLRSRDLIGLVTFDQAGDNSVGVTKVDLIEEGDLIGKQEGLGSR